MRRFNYRKSIKGTKSIKSNRSIKIFFVLLIFILLGYFVFLIFRVLTLDKFIYVNKVGVGDAEIIIVDPKADKTIRYLIPAENELDSARSYGNYKLGSLWTLSQKDENEGKLVAETITKNYSLPVFLWKNGKNSNLSLYQKISAFLSRNRFSEYDLKFDSSSNLPNYVFINFVEDQFVQTVPKIEVEDLTGDSTLAEKISKIIETTGGKITSNSKGYDKELDCKIVTKNSKIAKIYLQLFNCELILDKNLNGDLKLSLGAKFAQRF